MKTALRAFAVFILSAVLFAANTNRVFAQTTANNPPSSYFTPETNPDVPQNLHTLTQSIIISMMATFSCQLTGIDPLNPQGKCLGIDGKTGKIGFVNQGYGLAGMAANLITMTYNKPAGTADYINYLSSNFGIAKKTYAQGTGFDGLRPLINIWRAFRNITYLLFVLVTIFVGLGIMLRLQVDPRTVMTIQNQIPRIIIGLLLVTFSFAIAGLLIDLMWVSIYLIFNIFATIDKSGDIKNMFDNIYNIPHGFVNAMFSGSWLGTGSNGMTDIPLRASRAIGDVLGYMISTALASQIVGKVLNAILANTIFIPWTIGCYISGIFNSVSPIGRYIGWSPIDTYNCQVQAVRDGVGGFASLIAFLIIWLAIVIALFRLWFSLLKAYVFVLIDVIFAPFWIMSGILGTSGFSGWIRDLAANLVSFPVAITMFLLAKVMMSGFIANTYPNQFKPPLLGNPSDPSVFSVLIGLAIILMTPAAVKMARDTLKVQPFPYIAAAGASFGMGQAVAGVGAGAVWGRLTQPAQYDALGNELVPEGRLRRWALGTPSSGGKRGWRRRLANVR